LTEAAEGAPVDETWAPDLSWPKLPGSVALGQVPGIAAAPDGRVYVLQRGTPPVLVLDPDGELLGAWGEREIAENGGHFVRIAPDGNVWITDTNGHQVFRFTPEGRLLLALGRAGEAGDAPDQFDQPTDIAFLPSGEFLVSDGYGNTRLKRYRADGELLAIWGEPGRLPGQFDTPHAVCADSTGRLYVSDRGNTRIVVYGPDGAWQAEWRGLPYVDGLFCGADDTVYAATGRANGFLRLSTTEFETTGGLSDPIVLESYGGRHSTYREIVGHVPPPAGRLNVIHGISVDADGTVFAAEVRSRRVQRFLRTDGRRRH
jgi:sugar lactone lactonase YvrE